MDRFLDCLDHRWTDTQRSHQGDLLFHPGTDRSGADAGRLLPVGIPDVQRLAGENIQASRHRPLGSKAGRLLMGCRAAELSVLRMAWLVETIIRPSSLLIRHR